MSQNRECLLRLEISDVDGFERQGITKIANHRLVLAYMSLDVPESEIKERVVWRSNKTADVVADREKPQASDKIPRRSSVL